MTIFKKIKEYFLYFMMYSIIGWCYEVFLEVVVYQWGFSNRGFLFGPYTPIYGFGGLAFILCFNKLMKKKTPKWLRYMKPLIIFAGCALVATAIELLASYMMEAFTGSWPWQTYADYAINFQARIALSPSIRFGLGGVFFLYVLQPLFEKSVSTLSCKRLNVVFCTILGIVSLDLIITLAGMI